MCYLDSCYLDLIGILVTTLTCFIVSFFFAKLLEPKKKSKYYMWKYFGIIFGTYFVCRLHPFFYESRGLFISISYLVSMLLLAKDKIWKKLLLFFVTYFFVIIVGIITSCAIFSKYGYTFLEVNNLMDKEYFKLYELMYSDYNTLAMTGLNNVSLTFLFISLMMVLRKKTRHFYIWLISLVITVLVVCNCIFSYLYLSDMASLIVLLVCQIIAIAILIYVVQKLSLHFKYEESLEENSFLKEKEKMQLSYYEMLKNREDNVRKINHDIKNNLQVIMNIEDAKKRKEMIEEINNSLDQYHLKKYIPQDILNVVLNIKANEAINKGIKIDIVVKKSLDFMKDIDISNLITNILDNAIEATEKTNNKMINFSIKKKMNYIVIECENTYYGKLNINKKNELVTTKKGEHGYGSKIIKNVVEKYKGELNYEILDNKFKLIILVEKTEK